MKALGRTKFTDPEALRYNKLDVILKAVLSDFQQKCKYLTIEPGKQLDKNFHCTKLGMICKCTEHRTIKS